MLNELAQELTCLAGFSDSLMRPRLPVASLSEVGHGGVGVHVTSTVLHYQAGLQLLLKQSSYPQVRFTVLITVDVLLSLDGGWA